MATYTPSSEDVRLYECCVLYPYPMNQKEESELLKGIEEIFDEAGAKQIMKDVWGRRGLAYKIGGFREGNFIIYYYEIDPLKLKEVDNQLRILKGMLRHMIVKPPKHYQMASYSGTYEKWKEQSKTDLETKEREKEAKKLKTVVDKAKRATKKVETKKADEAADAAPAAPITEKDLSDKLEKLISDKDLEM